MIQILILQVLMVYTKLLMAYIKFLMNLKININFFLIFQIKSLSQFDRNHFKKNKITQTFLKVDCLQGKSCKSLTSENQRNQKQWILPSIKKFKNNQMKKSTIILKSKKGIKKMTIILRKWNNLINSKNKKWKTTKTQTQDKITSLLM